MFSVKFKPRIRLLSLLARLKMINQHRNCAAVTHKTASLPSPNVRIVCPCKTDSKEASSVHGVMRASPAADLRQRLFCCI